MAHCCGIVDRLTGYTSRFELLAGEEFAVYCCLFTCGYHRLREMLEIRGSSFSECADAFLYGSIDLEDDIGTGCHTCRNGRIACLQAATVGICRHFRGFLLAIAHLRQRVFCKS